MRNTNCWLLNISNEINLANVYLTNYNIVYLMQFIITFFIKFLNLSNNNRVLIIFYFY